MRSERLLMEQLDYNLLFRWFVGLSMDDAVWDADGVHEEPRAAAGRATSPRPSSSGSLAQAQAAALLSDEHFTVDGTLIEAWAGLKSFKRKDDAGPPPPDDPGQSDGELPRRAPVATPRTPRRPIPRRG